MKICGNDGIAAKLIPAFALMAGAFAVFLLVREFVEALPLILDWTHHVGVTGLLFSLAGFVVCCWCALLGRGD